ncbi:hypothetical protein [Pseudacidovorax intermedius]|uniref:hypothetical protein n=1 Tax=Pseudacidovorax intermedius TaxID=433924 RepID=UPI0026F36F27|nr:hypothetical protein [Pseudacidovorax intermedius]
MKQFCSSHSIGRTHFYALVKQGRGPQIMKVGRRTLISEEAATEWRRSMQMAVSVCRDSCSLPQ